jgi:hypothetical protein
MFVKVLVGLVPREDMSQEQCSHSILSDTDPEKVWVTQLTQAKKFIA